MSVPEIRVCTLVLCLFAAQACSQQTREPLRLIYRNLCSASQYTANVSLPTSDTFEDSIACAEPELELWQQTLLPDVLWCNSTVCHTKSMNWMEVHQIDCSEEKCDVVVHCNEKKQTVVQSLLATLAILFTLLVRLACTSSNSFANKPRYYDKQL